MDHPCLRDFTGTPVLYPTPNRVRNGVFRWEGKDYRQCRSGKLVLEHGLVHTEAWEAGLKTVKPGAVHSGSVTYAVRSTLPHGRL